MWPIRQREAKNLCSIERESAAIGVGVRGVREEMMKVWKLLGKWVLVENHDCRSWGGGGEGVVQPISWE